MIKCAEIIKMSSVRLSFVSVGRIAVRRNSQFTSGEWVGSWFSIELAVLQKRTCRLHRSLFRLHALRTV